MRRKYGAQLRSAWSVASIFSRMLVEHIATVWLLGIAPFLAHLAAATPQQGYRWIPNDLYLFVMVIGGACGMEAFKDRASEGPLRAIAGVFGFAAVVVGASAYASLESGTGPLNELWRAKVLTIIGTLFGIDLIYRVPRMEIDAMKENALHAGGA
jgi:hypothetical protein